MRTGNNSALGIPVDWVDQEFRKLEVNLPAPVCPIQFPKRRV